MTRQPLCSAEEFSDSNKDCLLISYVRCIDGDDLRDYCFSANNLLAVEFGS